MLSAEVLKGPVRNKRIEYLQLSLGDERLKLFNGNPQQLGSAFPGTGI